MVIQKNISNMLNNLALLAKNEFNQLQSSHDNFTTTTVRFCKSTMNSTIAKFWTLCESAAVN